MQGFPHHIPPEGWYQIGWSDDFPVGEARPLRYFGVDLVGYRGSSGDVVVMDAHCPHMGAHLGHGGVVDGDTIVCPFHGWQWASDGTNVHIPDGSRPNRAQRVGCWTAAENSGLVLLWFHSERRPPAWTVPDLVAPLDAFHSTGPARRCWTLEIHPQLVAENAVDSAHFSYVHRAASAPVILGIDDRGPNLHVSQEIVFGGRRSSTWLTPDGPVKGALEIDLWGLGLALTLFSGVDESYSLVATTPVDSETSEFRMTNWVPRASDEHELGASAQRRIDEQFKQAQRDFVIWENMRYIERPPLSKTEVRSYRAFRQWAERFYESSSTPQHLVPGSTS